MKNLATLFSAIFLLIGCAQFSQVSDDQIIPANDLMRYRRFAVTPRNVPINTQSPIVPGSALDQRIRREISEGFIATGLSVDPEFPELLAYYYFGVERLNEIGPFPYTIGVRSTKFLDGIYQGVKGRDKFIIDLVDIQNGELVWRGIDSLTQPYSPDRINKEIPKLISRITQKFPG